MDGEAVLASVLSRDFIPKSPRRTLKRRSILLPSVRTEAAEWISGRHTKIEEYTRNGRTALHEWSADSESQGLHPPSSNGTPA